MTSTRRPDVPFRLLALATLSLSAPVAAVLAVLVALDMLAFGPAVVALWVAGLCLALIARAHLVGLQAVRAYAEELARTGAADAPPAGTWGPAGDLAATIRRLRRVLAEREAKLKVSRSIGDAVLEALPDPILMVDDSQRIVDANRAARALLGERLKGRDLPGVLRVPAVLEAVESAFAYQTGSELEFSLAAPVERTLSVRVEALAPDGERMAIVAVHDVTAIKRTDQMRTDFIANASHELKTPITTLLGFIETLQGPTGEKEEERERFLAIMGHQATRMARLVQDLLSLTRIELSEHASPSAQVEIGVLLHGVIESLEPKVAAAGLEIVLDIPDDLPPVAGDGDQLNQVFQNLIDNAIQYGADGGRIEVSARPAEQVPARTGRHAGQAVAVAVRDWGQGISRQHLPRLTERFFRVDAARSRELGGTGLGLAIVKHVVNRHRGALTIDSELGQGSTFIVYLPAAPRP